MRIKKIEKNFFYKNTLLKSREILLINEKNERKFLNNKRKYNSIFNKVLLNNISFLNKNLEYINSKLIYKGELLLYFESFQSRRSKLKIRNYKFISDLYFLYEFFIHRFLPKSYFKKIYYLIYKNRYRHLSRAEVFGRLVCCGFEIINYKNIKRYSYVLVKKISKPKYDLNPSYGLFISLRRYGKNNMFFNTYKLRTMHPYSEYLHDFTLKKYGYGSKGKPKNDFRITPWGKYFRKFWLDELPQLYNFIKGDLKIVGVRPVSERFYKDIPKDLQLERKKLKPGCIPPYICLNKKSDLQSVFESERIYIKRYKKNPIITDVIFLFYAIVNILYKGRRSQ